MTIKALQKFSPLYLIFSFSQLVIPSLSREKQISYGDYFFSPYVAPGWDATQYTNFRPGQWLGLLKVLSAMGAENFHTSNFAGDDGDRVIADYYIWETATSAYAQAITSRYQDIFRNGRLLRSKTTLNMGAYFDNSNQNGYLTNIGAYMWQPQSPHHAVVVRQAANPSLFTPTNANPMPAWDDDANFINKYVITGSIQPTNNNNVANGLVENLSKNVNVEVGGKIITFPIRRQGSTYFFDLNGASPIFYQLDGWHQYEHPIYWSKDFVFEAELYDNPLYTFDVSTEGTIQTTTGWNFTNVKSYITFNSNNVNNKVRYNFTPRSGNGTTANVAYTLEMTARSTQQTGNETVTVYLDSNYTNPITTFNITNLAPNWGNTYTFALPPLSTNQDHYLELAVSNTNVEIEILKLTNCLGSTSAMSITANTPCQGTATLSVPSAPNLTYVWSSPDDVAVATNTSSTYNVPSNLSGSLTYTVQIQNPSNATCGVSTLTKTIDIHPALAPTISVVSACTTPIDIINPLTELNSVIFSITSNNNNAAVSCVWTAPNNEQYSTIPTYSPTFNINATLLHASYPSVSALNTALVGVHNFLITDEYGCTANVSATVNANQFSDIPPTPTIAGSSPVCSGAGLLQANPSTGYNYSWVVANTGANNFVAVSGATSSSYIPTSTSAVSKDYKVGLIDQVTGCATFSSIFTVTVNPIPSSASPGFAGSNKSICANATIGVTIGSANNSAYSYSWTPATGLSSTTVSNPIALPSVNTTYTVDVTNIATGCTATDDMVVTVNPLPAPPTITATGTFTTNPTNGVVSFCPGGLTLATNPSSGYTYSWKYAPWSLTNGTISNGTFTPVAGGVTSTFSPTSASAYTGDKSYYVEIKDANNCSAVSNIIYTTASILPSVSLNPTCLANTGVKLTRTSLTGVTYQWYKDNQLINPNPTASFYDVDQLNESGSYTVVATLNGCSNTSAPKVVILPTITAPATSLCDGTNLNISASAGTSYLWKQNGSTITGASTQSYSVTTAGSYQAVVGIATPIACNINTNILPITVNPLPVVTASSNAPVCAGNTLTLTTVTNTAYVSYAWSGPNGFTSNQSNPIIANATMADAGAYTLTITDVNGCTNMSTTNVVVNPSPTVSPSSSSPICEGSALTLDAVTNAAYVSYAWSGPNGFTNNQSNLIIANATTADAGSYSLTVIDANGCTNMGTTNVVVNPSPISPSLSSSSPICAGNTLTLTAVTNATYVSYAWSGPNGFTNNQSNPIILNATTTDAGSYTLTVTNANGCTNMGTTNVVVNPSPISPVLSSSSPICAGNALTLDALTNSAYVSYAWSGPNGFTSNQSNSIIANATTANTGNYSLLVTDANGCSNSGNIAVVVNAVPNVNITATPNTAVCPGTQVTLTANATNPIPSAFTYLWSGGSTATNIAILPTATSVYDVVVTNEANCTNTAQYTVPVLPPLSVNITGNATICVGGAATLTANLNNPLPAGATIQWKKQTSTGWQIQAGATSLTYTTPVLTSANTTTIYQVVISNLPCGNITASPFSVNVVPDQTTSISSSSPAACMFNQSTLTLNVFNGTALSYQWQSAPTNTGPWTNVAGANTTNYTTPMVSTTSYYKALVSSTAPGCPTLLSSSVVTVGVLPTPNVVITPAAPTICDGGGVTLSVNNSSAYTYSWYSIPTGINAMNSSVSVNPMATSTYNVAVTNVITGCSKIVSATVTVVPDPVVSITAPANICYKGTLPLAANVQGGTGNYTYAWQRKIGTGGWTAIGSNTATLSLSNANVTQTADYRVLVSNTLGCNTTSNPVTVTVDAPATILSLSGTSNVCYGASANLSVANGTPGCTYAWQVSSNGTSWGNVSNTGSSLATGALTAPRWYRVYQTCTAQPCPVTVSNVFQVTVHPSMTLTAASNNTICEGGFRTLTATSPANPNFSYTWSPATWLSTTTANSTVATPPLGTYVYTVVATNNTTGCTKSATHTVNVVPDQSVSISAPTVTPLVGSPLTLTSAITGGTGTCTIQWQSSLSGTTWTNIAGATGITYTIPSAALATIHYRARMICSSSGCPNPRYSTVLSITGTPAPSRNNLSATQPLLYQAKVFPNPATSLLNLAVETNQDTELQLSIYDATGRLISKWKAQTQNASHTQEINLEKYAIGIYFLKVESQGIINTYKFVKE